MFLWISATNPFFCFNHESLELIMIQVVESHRNSFHPWDLMSRVSYKWTDSSILTRHVIGELNCAANILNWACYHQVDVPAHLLLAVYNLTFQMNQLKNWRTHELELVVSKIGNLCSQDHDISDNKLAFLDQQRTSHYCFYDVFQFSRSIYFLSCCRPWIQIQSINTSCEFFLVYFPQRQRII